jgi:mannose-6-phosphate isomerase-like protein (cupin superfamily)
MGEPSVIAAGEGEIVGDAADRRVEILADADPVHATWSRFGPGREGADLHVHHHHTDLFYVLDGELTVRMGIEDRQVAVGPGNLVCVPPLVVHGFRNAGAADVRYLNFHAPGCGFAGFMRGRRDGTGTSYDQVDPPADGGRPVSEASIGAARTLVDEPGRRVEALCDIDAIAITRTELAAGREGDPGGPGYLYVLSGAARLRHSDREVRVETGGWATVPADVSPLAEGPEPLAYLTVRAPR